MNDIRRDARRRTLKGASIVFNDGRSTIDCTVRNLSDSGALLRVVSIIGVPSSFELVIGSEPGKKVRVVRMTGTELAVQFVP